MRKVAREILMIVLTLTICVVNAQHRDTTDYFNVDTIPESMNASDIEDSIVSDEDNSIIIDSVETDNAVVDYDENLPIQNVDYIEDTTETANDTIKDIKKSNTDTTKNKEEKLELPPEKGLYLGLGLGVGLTDFHFKLQAINGKGADHKMRLGGQLGLNASYYFSRHWGISLGVAVSLYRSMGVYKGFESGNYFNLGSQVLYFDDKRTDSAATQIRARLTNWEELQQAYFLDIPLMLMYQTKWKKGKHGLYFGIGVKYQLPFQAKYKVIDSEYGSSNNSDPDTWRLNVSGYNTRFGDLGAPIYNANTDTWTSTVSVPEFGIGTISNPNERLGWNGKMSIKGSWTGIAEFGFLFGLSRRVDLTLGAYFEYGFNNVEKGEDYDLMKASENYFQLINANGRWDGRSVGEGIEYSGLINSKQTTRTNLMSVGAKIGVRVKIGKLRAKDPWQEEPEVISKDSTPEDPLKKLEDLITKLLDQPNQNQPSVLIIKDNPNNQNNPSPNDPNDPNTNRTSVADAPYKSNYNPELTPQEMAILECCVYFDYAKYYINQSELWCLEQKLEILNNHPNVKLKVLGNTCDLSGDAINVPLGMNRAKSAKQWLVDRGISPDRLITITLSKYQPQVPNDSEANRKLNRRACFEIIY